ncbi:MAG: glycosyltransferase [Pseudomonadota bacterium]
MIFLTVGTQLPFDRLTRAVDAWAAANPSATVFGQIAQPDASGYRPKNFETCAFLEPAEVERRFQTADAVIGHAGMGTIITALTHAKPLLIMPRRAHLSEQRNDHQFGTAGRFGDKPGVSVIHEEHEAKDAIDRLWTRARTSGDPDAGPAISPVAEARLTKALRTFIWNDA